MKQEEKSVLFNQKLDEGKTSNQANFEIQRDILFIKNTKSKIKQEKKLLQKELKLLEKEKLNMQKNFQKEFKKLKKEQDKLDEPVIKSHAEKNIATIRDLNRIMAVLNMEKQLGLNELTKTCNLKADICASALKFLELNNLIIKEKQGRISVIKLI